MTRQFTTNLLLAFLAEAKAGQWPASRAIQEAQRCSADANLAQARPSDRNPIQSIRCGHIGALADALERGDWKHTMAAAKDMNLVIPLRVPTTGGARVEPN